MLRDHRNERIRYARERARQLQAPKEYGDFLENLLRWDWFVTITFAWSPGPGRARKELMKFWEQIERAAQHPIGWVMVEGFGEIGGRFHVHALISGVDDLSEGRWWRIAEARFGSSNFDLYEPGEGAARYLAKHALDPRGSIYFGGQLLQPGDSEKPPSFKRRSPA